MADVTKWTDCALGDVVNLKRGYDLPERDRVEGEYPIVSSSGVTGSHNIAKVRGPGVVTGRYGTLGEVFYIPGDFWPLNTSLYVQDFKDNDPRFVSYLLRTLNFGQRSGAAAVPGVNRNALHLLRVRMPDVGAQRKITAILSAYDDLIENNLRRIKILEEMAQNLYHEWFVKFRFPGYQHARFTDSPLGSIPVGWEARELREFVDFELGVEPGSKNYASQLSKNYVPFLRVGDLGKRESDLFVNKSFARGRILTPDDIAITMDGTVGLVRMGLEGAYSSGIRRVARKSDCPIGNAFIFQLLNSERIQAIIEAHAKGTTIKHASSSIDHMTFVLPDRIVAEAFEEYAEPINSLTL